MRNNLSQLISLSKIEEKLYRPADAYEQSRVTRMEHVNTTIVEKPQEGIAAVAARIAKLINRREANGQKTVLSLASGRSMRDLFVELVRLHKEEGLSFKNVVLFGSYEFYPLADASLGSMGQIKSQLLDQVDILPENVHTFPGDLPKETVFTFCEEYEKAIEAAGGIDIQVLGIGQCGNIAMNEPGTQPNSSTRLVIMDGNSRVDAKSLFGNIAQVPTCAITLGIDTILQAKEVILLAFGQHKAGIVKQAIEEVASAACPASYLQLHKNASFVIDLDAAGKLTRINHPWKVTNCEWTDQLVRRAVVWLCEQTKKPILKLTNKDYNDYGLSELITKYDSAYNCNIKVFNDLQHTITGWPGGKPNADDTNRPERANPFPKDIVIFSPHPDDDVISMGGTFQRLIKQGHNVHVAYETSGCIAVCDEEVVRFMDFMKGYKQMLIPGDEVIEKKYDEYMNFFKNEKVGDNDTREILNLKALIRRGEATAACRYMGLPTDHIHFLNLPFYETGTIKKGPLSQADVDIVKALLEEVKPQQIFAAGDLADPHGTHRVCLDAVLAALDELKHTAAWDEWLKDCRIWMYRGAWMEWELDLVEMAVPMSPEELRSKRNAILRHASQMESAPFLGDDERLFWQRAEDRNHDTAKMYSDLGLAEYEAIEAFVQYHIL